MNSTTTKVIVGSWSPSTPSSAPSYPAPVHWTMSQLDNLPPPPPYNPSKEDYYLFENSDEIILLDHVESFARNMFWWGFLLPLFWIAGIFLIFSKLRAPATWDEEKTPEESARILSLLREAELRWAWRCAYALSTLSLVALFLFLIVKFSILSG